MAGSLPSRRCDGQWPVSLHSRVDIRTAGERHCDVVGALDNLHGNLRTELRDVESARSQLASAQDKKAKADQAVAATRKRIDDLTA
jgi:hypothetical protein